MDCPGILVNRRTMAHFELPAYLGKRAKSRIWGLEPLVDGIGWDKFDVKTKI